MSDWPEIKILKSNRIFLRLLVFLKGPESAQETPKVYAPHQSHETRILSKNIRRGTISRLLKTKSQGACHNDHLILLDNLIFLFVEKDSENLPIKCQMSFWGIRLFVFQEPPADFYLSLAILVRGI